MQCKTIIGLSVLGVGGYLAYLYFSKNGLANMNALEAHDKWELTGYLNGLVRGAGGYDSAINELQNWKDYWSEVRPELQGIVLDWYNYAVERAKIVYY